MEPTSRDTERSARVETLCPLGDMYLAMSAPVRIMSSLARYPARFLEPASLRAMRGAINDAGLAWESQDPANAAAFLGDPTLYEGVEIPGCLALLRFRPAGQQALEKALQSCAVSIDAGAKIIVDDVIGLLFDSGIVSVLVFVRHDGGWTAPAKLLGPDHRETFARIVQLELEGSLAPVAHLLARRVHKNERIGPDRAEPTLAEVPYIDFITGGQMAAFDDELALEGSLRRYVQPDTPKRLRSQSPLQNEFVWLGSVCSVVFTVERAAFELRFREIATLIAVYSALFDQLTSICAEVSRVAELEHNQSLEELRRYEERINIYFREISGPSFTYKKDLRVLRSHIYTQWEVAPLFERAQFLLATLNRRTQDKRNRRAENSARITNVILLVLAAATLVSVFNDGLQMLDRLGTG